MIGYFKNRDRVTLLNQSFWHTRQRSFRRGEICQLIHRPRLGCRPRGLHFSWTQGTGTRGGIIPGRALATTLLGVAWIEDAEQRVLLVRQAVGLRLWTLPGGKVKRGESLVKAIRRELYEETGLRVEIGSLLGVLDRRDKDAITLLFAAVPNNSSIKVKQNNREIERADFQASLPKKASPSA